MQPTRTSGIVRFGPFAVDVERRMITKHGVRVRLQTQPFHILAALLEKPGAIVSRDELRRRLWSENTFVDFEHGLNAAVARLRHSLGDCSEEPRYIETVSKWGYRFAAIVKQQTVSNEEAPIGRVSASGHRAARSARQNEELLGSDKLRRPRMQGEPRRSRLLWITAAVALAVATAAGFVSVLPKLESPSMRRAVPLTAFRGFEGNPNVSPDGSHVAFTWNGEKQDNFDIYVLAIPSGTLARLTTDTAEDLSPTWSPDGRTIAFLRRRGDRSDLMLTSATGGPEHKVAETQERTWFQLRKSSTLAWSPDGRWIAASHREPGESTDGIYLFSITGEKRRLTTPPLGFRSDNMPSFSPDGRTLAFCRLPGAFVSEVYLLPLDGRLQPSGEVRRLTQDNRWSAHPVWTADGQSILYVFGQDGGKGREIRMVSVARPRAPTQTIPLRDEASEIALGRHLVYSRQIEDTNIWRAELPQLGATPVAAKLLITSTQPDQTPQYSPDGRRIAFASARSGAREIWVSNADGSSAVRATSLGAPVVGYPSWSPDGRWIAFHARFGDKVEVFAIPAAGGSAKRLATNSWAPSYAVDGQTIYFSSGRSGDADVWKQRASGGEPQQLTATRWATQPAASHDGKLVYFLRQDRNEIWSVPAESGQPLRVAGPTQRYPVGFAVTSKGIYYGAPPHNGEDRYIRFFDFSTSEDKPVVVVNRPFHIGMSVSPDSRYILFDQYDESGSDLMMIEDFASRR